MSPRRTVFLGGLIMAGLTAIGACSAQPELFPFVIPWDDASPSVANVSAWNDPIPAKGGFVTVKGGHFYDAKGKRLRFLGTNVCFRADFSTHEMADIVAARMAKFGINIVRFHHEDSSFFPDGIWDRAYNDKTHLSAEALDRYDYFIHALKKHGIYTDINLHVSRTLDAAAGIEDADKLPSMNKGVDNFHPRMIELQRKYARELLTHVNKYTGNAYINEPAIAVIEINNENSLIAEWRWTGIDGLPQSTLKYLDAAWVEFLRGKYKNNAGLRAAWALGEEKLGAEMMANGDFSHGTDGWTLEQSGTGKAVWAVAADGPEGKPALKISVQTTDETTWHVQAHCAPLDFEQDKTYTVSFWGKADPARRVSVSTFTTREPWHGLGLSDDVALTPEWKRFTLHFAASETYEGGRIGFSGLAGQVGDVWVSGMSLKPGGILGVSSEDDLDAGRVARPGRTELQGRSKQCQSDYVEFLIWVEKTYWQGMHDFIKKDLKAHAAVTGTQMGYTPIETQQGMEYIDNHSYWHHPWFPHRQWDGRDWWVTNASMVGSQGAVIPELAGRRVKGYPYTISEFNSPAPNQYSAESHLILAAYGALQDWDGIFNFAWSHSDEWNIDRIPNFFDLKSHTPKLVVMPAVAALIRRGDVSPASVEIVASTTPAASLKTPWDPTTASLAWTHGVQPSASLVHRVSVKPGAAKESVSGPMFRMPDDKVFVSDNGQLTWNLAEKGREFVAINTPNSKALIGFTDGRTGELGEVAVTPGKTRLGWSCITLTAMDGTGFAKPGRILLTASGYAENQGWGWETDGENVTVRDQWGKGPTLCEGIPAHFEIKGLAPARAQVWALDQTGKRVAEVKVSDAGGHAAFDIGPENKTLWYEVVVR